MSVYPAGYRNADGTAWESNGMGIDNLGDIVGVTNEGSVFSYSRASGMQVISAGSNNNWVTALKGPAGHIIKNEYACSVWKSGSWQNTKLVWGYGINVRGDIAGEKGGYPKLAAVERNGVLEIIGTFANAKGRQGAPAGSLAVALNNVGQTIGLSDSETSEQKPFIYERGIMTDLNSLIPSDSGWMLNGWQAVTGINDLGEIVGWGTRGNEQHAFILRPITVRFASATQQTWENAGSYYLKIDRGGDLSISVSVDITVGGGTAIRGVDYTFIEGRMTFAPGQSSLLVPIQVINNNVVERADALRTVDIALSNPTEGFAIGTLAKTTVVILDDDFVPPPDPVRPPIADVPPATPTKKGLILLAHGWNASPSTWANDMAAEITARLTEKGVNDQWHIWAYDWSESAADDSIPGFPDIKNPGLKNPGRAMNRAKAIGTQVGRRLRTAGYDQIHFIGHSAGSWLIDKAADALFLSGVRIHSTFLDSYVPTYWPWQSGPADLGDSADFAEQYMHADNDPSFHPDLPWTQEILPSAVNFDITRLHGRHLSPFEGHAWPPQWYTATTQNPTGSAAFSLGFQLAPEFAGTMQRQADYPEGGRIIVGASSFRSVADSTAPPTVSPGIHFGGPVNVVPSISIKSGSTAVRSESVGSFILTANPSVWFKSVIQFPEATNVFKFDYQFKSDGEGWLSIFLDGSLILEIDERASAKTISSELLWFETYFAAGEHTLTFRFDAFSPTQSRIDISDVRFGTDTIANGGLTPAVELSSVTDGAMRIQFATITDRTYQILFSDDLLNWLPAGGTFVGTGKMVLWIDDGTLTGAHPSSRQRRFYKVSSQ